MSEKVMPRAEDKNVHTTWALAAVQSGLARFVSKKANGEDVVVTIKNVPEKNDITKIPFNAIEYTVSSPEEAAKLWQVFEDGKAECENAFNDLLNYAYGLQRRSSIRVGYESGFTDPEAADKRLAATLVKQGRAKNEAQAMKLVALLKAAKVEGEDEDE